MLHEHGQYLHEQGLLACLHAPPTPLRRAAQLVQLRAPPPSAQSSRASHCDHLLITVGARDSDGGLQEQASRRAAADGAQANLQAARLLKPMAGGSANAQRGRGGAQGGKAARAEPAEASEAAPAATDGQQQDEEAAQPAAASGGDQGSSAARGGRPVKQPQLEPKGVREARQAFLQYCRGQPLAIAKIVDQKPTRLTQLLFSRLQLTEACLRASQASGAHATGPSSSLAGLKLTHVVL